MLETSHSFAEERFGHCENCNYHTKLIQTKGFAGAFLGNPVYDDQWLCRICADTMDLRRGMEKDRSVKLMLYLTNEIIESLTVVIERMRS